ncbi:hypothetical protein RA307_04875 [Xanthobacteraceae bacterium Astr-EGSB]|uniref:hypothetical protein n=1 Tax=Astrobacterium formosum TaxID=3069710 RepID=UPI0027B09F39|nr:hypothetical protein [Xanthobacteraceae bacterium Astr-EGSB]
MSLEPAHTIIRKFGGPSAVANITGAHRTRVSNWQRPKSVGGTGGVVPQRHHRALLDYARQHDIPLSAEEFVAPADANAAA